MTNTLIFSLLDRAQLKKLSLSISQYKPPKLKAKKSKTRGKKPKQNRIAKNFVITTRV